MLTIRYRKRELSITHRFKFKDYKKAYDLIDQEKDKAMKVMIEME